jgi:hypothetical protein
MKTFRKDLDRGVKVESLVLQRIQKKYPNTYRIEGYCKEYDLWIPEVEKGIEVKYDPMSNQTGNIVVEIEMFGKPSALMTTKATYWVFYDDNVFVWIKPNDIKKCIEDNKLRTVKFTGRGDTHSKIAYLIKKEMLFSYGKQFNNYENN